MRVRSQRNSKRRTLLIVAGLFLAVVVFGMLLPRVFASAAALVMTPVHSLHVWIATSEMKLPVYIRDRNSLAAQIADLEDRVNATVGLRAGYAALQQENQRLRRLLSATTSPRVAASVVARPSDLPYDLLQLDRGSAAGIQVGAPVYAGADVVIGIVVYTAPQYSFVELVSTPGFTSTVFLGGPNVIATLDGQGGGVMRVRVPQGVPLAVGDTVMIPSIATEVIGRVVRVEQHPTQPEQYGYLTLPIAIQSLHSVAVGQPNDIQSDVSVIEHELAETLRRQALVVQFSTTSFAVATSSASSTDSSTTSSSLPQE